MNSIHHHHWTILRVSIAFAIGMAVALTAWAQSPGRHQGTIASVSDSLLVLEVESVEYPFRWEPVEFSPNWTGPSDKAATRMPLSKLVEYYL